MHTPLQSRRNSCRRPKRRGAALLMCLFLVFVVSSLLLNIIDTETLQLSAARNVEDYERALYLANAGVHHACAELEDSPPAPLPHSVDIDGYPTADGSYQYIISAGPGTNNVTIDATGKSGNVERRVRAVAEVQ